MGGNTQETIRNLIINTAKKVASHPRVTASIAAGGALAIGGVAEAIYIYNDGQAVSNNHIAISKPVKDSPTSCDGGASLGYTLIMSKPGTICAEELGNGLHTDKNISPQIEPVFMLDQVKQSTKIAYDLLSVPVNMRSLSFKDIQKEKGIIVGEIVPLGFTPLARNVTIGDKGVFLRREPTREEKPLRPQDQYPTFNQGEKVSIIATINVQYPDGSVDVFGLTEIPYGVYPVSPDQPKPEAPNVVGNNQIQPGWIKLYTVDKNQKVDWAVKPKPWLSPDTQNNKNSSNQGTFPTHTPKDYLYKSNGYLAGKPVISK